MTRPQQKRFTLEQMKQNAGLPSELYDCGDLEHESDLISQHLYLLIFVN
jgi:hypothetical protein